MEDAVDKTVYDSAIKPNIEYLKEFFDGKWVESNKVQELFNMTFSECMSIFDMSRTAEWWSVVGTTEEERQCNGQKITVNFRLKKMDSQQQ